MKLKIVTIVFLFGFMNCFGQTDLKKLRNEILINKIIDTVYCNQLVNYIELEEDETIWPKYNTKLKNILLKIISNKKLQQIKKDWYLRKLITCLMYDAQNRKSQYSDFSNAIKIQFEMLKYANSINDLELVVLSYNEISSTFASQKMYDKALLYFLKNEKILNSTNNYIQKSLTYNNIGQTYSNLKQFEKAIYYFEKSFILKKQYAPKEQSIVINNLALVYLNQKNFKKAKSLFNLALNLNEENKQDRYICRNLINLAKIDEFEENINNAITKTEKSLFIAEKINDLPQIEVASSTLAHLYELNGNTSDAFAMFKKATKIKDSILNDEKRSTILKAEFKYETEKKEAQIKTLSQQKQIAKLESQRQKIGLGLLGLSIVSILISGYLLFKRYKTNKQNEILKMQLLESSKTFEAEKKAAQSELKALKSQMNPHFIFNALNGIQEQFMFGDKVVANEQMGNFTALTRQILSVSGKKTITIATEIDLLTKYLELEKMRFDTGFEYKITCSEKIDDDYDEIPPMIIQPFAENAIKHGLLHKSGEKKLTLFFDRSENDDYLLCTVEDNGVGRQKSAEIKAKSLSTHESFSTQSISQRLDILKKDGVNEDLVVYQDVLDNDNLIVGTVVLVKIPVGE